jgi:hypothetical protein
MHANAPPCRRVLFPITLFLVLAAVPAAAQDPDARHVSLGVAGGIATPYHGDFDFTAGSWQMDVRIDTARHFGLGVFFEDWRHTDEDVFTDQTILGPSGPLGRADRVTARTGHRTRALGWNLLARGRAGRATIVGGGGISYLAYSRDFSQTMSVCVPATVCRDFSNDFDNSSFATQLQAGIDVDVAPHLAVMGQFRLLVPIQDPGGGHTTFMAGIRVVF